MNKKQRKEIAKLKRKIEIINLKKAIEKLEEVK